MHGHAEKPKQESCPREIEVALPVKRQLIRSVVEIKRSSIPIDQILGRVSHHEPVHTEKPARGCRCWQELPPTRQPRSDLDVSQRAYEPRKPNRMSEQYERQKHRAINPSPSLRSPKQREAETSQSQRQIVVHETHVEGIPVRQHRDARREKPWHALRNCRHERESAPEENQHGGINRNFLRDGIPNKFPEAQQHEIEQNVVPAAHQVEPWRLSLFNELCKPRVVHMTRQIARLNPPVPEARNREQNRQKQNPQFELPQKPHHVS